MACFIFLPGQGAMFEPPNAALQWTTTEKSGPSAGTWVTSFFQTLHQHLVHGAGGQWVASGSWDHGNFPSDM